MVLYRLKYRVPAGSFKNFIDKVFLVQFTHAWPFLKTSYSHRQKFNLVVVLASLHFSQPSLHSIQVIA